jgi:AraC-like DNA-binding protein
MITLPLSYFPILAYKNIHAGKVKVLFTFVPISLFLIFYNMKISKKTSVQNSKIPENEDTASEKNTIKETNGENLQMYSEIYQRIKEYLETETPWKNPDFGIQDLAHQFGINTTYLSKAISLNTDTNFKNLINTYRINYIKDEMKINYPKYTLMHIYVSAGFKHQSTFNRAFKQIENKTLQNI